MQFCAACGDQTTEKPCASCGSDPDLDGRYTLRELLGQGSHGMTWRAEAPDGSTVAVKVINLGHGQKPEAQRALDREVAVLRQLSHDRIPALLDDFSTRSGMTRYRCIVQEFVDGPHLLDELETTRQTPQQVMATIAEIAEILTYLHDQTPPIIHRDIKPQNLIRRASDGALVLIDFGSVRDTLVGTLGGTMSVGTVGYMAPEQITGEVRPASDLYALGALAVHLLTRQPPKLTHDPANPVRWRRPDSLPDDIGDLVDSLLDPDPVRRPASARILALRARSLARARPIPPTPRLPKRPIAHTPPIQDGPPVQLASAELRPPSRWGPVVLYGLLGGLSVVSTVASLVDIESIMVTGAIGSVLGLISAAVAHAHGQKLGRLASLSAPAFSVFCFLLIALTGMSPGEAEGPIPVMLGFYTVGLIATLAAASRQSLRQGRAEKVDLQARMKQKRAEWEKQRKLPAYMPALQPVVGSRREREELKVTAAQWRAGVVPELRHVCPFCGVSLRPDELVSHYDTTHRPDAMKQRRIERNFE